MGFKPGTKGRLSAKTCLTQSFHQRYFLGFPQRDSRNTQYAENQSARVEYMHSSILDSGAFFFWLGCFAAMTLASRRRFRSDEQRQSLITPTIWDFYAIRPTWRKLPESDPEQHRPPKGVAQLFPESAFFSLTPPAVLRRCGCWRPAAWPGNR